MDRETLKKWFQRGKKPTESQFAELIDSFRHVDEKLKVSDVENLAALIAQKMTREDALTLHEALAESIAELEQLKATHEDVHTAIEQYHAPQEWTSESNLNDYTDTGVYHFSGYRLSAVDNLPIESIGETVNIAFTLIVDKQEGSISETTHVPCIVSQTLFLGNRQGSETKAYVRNCTIFFDGQSDKWESWRELMQTTYLGVLNSYDDLNTATEIGLYTGAMITLASNVADVFKLEVINNYAVTTKVSAATGSSVPNSVLQTITILNLDGNNATKKRIGTYNGSGYTWTKWESQSLEVPTATQTTLGAVKGSSTVEVREDGSLSVEYQGLNYLSQGRNVLIGGDGKINVDGVSHTTIDNDLSDGEINDVKVYYEPTKKLADLRHEYKNEIASGGTQTESKIVQVPSLYPADNEKSLVGNISERTTTLDASVFKRPHSAAFKQMGEWWKVYDHISFVVWEETKNRAMLVISEMEKEKYKDYYGNDVNLGSNFVQYPYMKGRFVFELTNSNYSANITSNYRLYNNEGELLGVFAEESGKQVLRLSSVRADGQQTNWEDYLPLSLKCDYACKDENHISDFSLTLTIKTEESESSNWTNIQTNVQGRVMRVVGYKTVTYPDTITTYDHTRCIAIAKDGISIQSVNGNHEQKELYINIDDSGNIVTNIGEFING